MLGLVFLVIIIARVKAILRSDNELTVHCYDFPARDFGKANNVKSLHGASPKLILNIGDTAIDFTLATPSGERVQLSTLLAKKPVVMIWGHYTCPAFQGLHSDTMFLGSSFEEEKIFVESNSDVVQVLHMIGPEPHPMWPFSNFDSGSIKMNYWSSIKQPETYQERLDLSAAAIEPLLHPDVTVLVDDLDGKVGRRNNPVWCSYAQGARSAILIGQDGVVVDAQGWFSREDLTKSVRRLALSGVNGISS